MNNNVLIIISEIRYFLSPSPINLIIKLTKHTIIMMKPEPHKNQPKLDQCYCSQYSYRTVQPFFRHQHSKAPLSVKCIFCLHSNYMGQYSKFVTQKNPKKSEATFAAKFDCCKQKQVGGLVKMKRFLLSNCCVDGQNCQELKKHLKQNNYNRKQKYIVQLDYHITVGVACYNRILQKVIDKSANIAQKSIQYGINKLSIKTCLYCESAKVNIVVGTKSQVQERRCPQCHKKLHLKEEQEQIMRNSIQQNYCQQKSKQVYFQQNLSNKDIKKEERPKNYQEDPFFKEQKKDKTNPKFRSYNDKTTDNSCSAIKQEEQANKLVNKNVNIAKNKLSNPPITQSNKTITPNQDYYHLSGQSFSIYASNYSTAQITQQAPLHPLFTQSQKTQQYWNSPNTKEKLSEKVNQVKQQNDQSNNQPQENQSETFDSVISQGQLMRKNQTSKKQVIAKNLSQNKIVFEPVQGQIDRKKSYKEKTSGLQDLNLQRSTSKDSFQSFEYKTEQDFSSVSLITNNKEIIRQNTTVPSQTLKMTSNSENSQHLASTQFTVLQNFDPLPQLEPLQRLSYPAQYLLPDINPKAEDPSTYFSIEQHANDQYFNHLGFNPIKIQSKSQQLNPSMKCHNCKQYQVILSLDRFCTKCFYQYLLGNVKIMK